MARYFNDSIRCYEDGKIERLFKNKGWKEVSCKDNSNGYNCIQINDKRLKRHRIIASLFLGLNVNDLTIEVDHINRIRTDNRAENLRLVTHSQNAFNKGAKGCSLDKRDNKWNSQLMVNGKNISLGRFDTEAEAHQAYLDAKLKYHIIL